MKLNGTYLDGFLLPVPTAKLEEKSFLQSHLLFQNHTHIIHQSL